MGAAVQGSDEVIGGFCWMVKGGAVMASESILSCPPPAATCREKDCLSSKDEEDCSHLSELYSNMRPEFFSFRLLISYPMQTS